MTVPGTPDGAPVAAPRTAAGVAWTAAALVAHAGMALAVLAVHARWLEPDEVGAAALATSLVMVIQVASTAGLGPALVQRTALSIHHERAAALLLLLLGLGTTTALWWGSAPIAGLLGVPAASPAIHVAAGAVLLRCLAVVPEARLRRALHFGRLAAFEFAASVVLAAVAIVAALRGWGAQALPVAHLAQAAVHLGLLALAGGLVAPAWHRLGGPELLRFGGGHTVAQFLAQLAAHADNWVVGRLLGATALSFYSRAFQLTLMPATLIGQVADKVFFPAMARLQDDRAALNRSFAEASGVVAMLALPAMALCLLRADDIVLVLLGPRWAPTADAIRVLAIALLPRLSYKLCDALVRATGDVWAAAGWQAVYAMAILAFAAIGARQGVGGVAAGVTIAMYLKWALMLRLARRRVGLDLRLLVRRSIPAVGTTAAFVALTLLLPAGDSPLGRIAASSALAVAALAASVRLHQQGARRDRRAAIGGAPTPAIGERIA
jgi:PST family polysaccharide transporter